MTTTIRKVSTSQAGGWQVYRWEVTTDADLGTALGQARTLAYAELHEAGLGAAILGWPPRVSIEGSVVFLQVDVFTSPAGPESGLAPFDSVPPSALWPIF